MSDETSNDTILAERVTPTDLSERGLEDVDVENRNVLPRSEATRTCSLKELTATEQRDRCRTGAGGTRPSLLSGEPLFPSLAFQLLLKRASSFAVVILRSICRIQQLFLRVHIFALLYAHVDNVWKVESRVEQDVWNCLSILGRLQRPMFFIESWLFGKQQFH